MFLEIFLLVLGLCFCAVGILGSILPVLPGPPLSWLGLLMLYLLPSVPLDYWFLGITLGIAIFIFALDYAMPIIGTKYFGGSRAGAIGSTVGLVVGLFFPPFGFFDRAICRRLFSGKYYLMPRAILDTPSNLHLALL